MTVQSSKILLEILVCACLLTMLGSFVDFGAMIHDAVEPKVEAILKEVLPAWTGVRSMPDAFEPHVADVGAPLDIILACLMFSSSSSLCRQQQK